MAFEVAWTRTARRALSSLPEKTAAAVIETCYGALSDNPHRVGKPLRLELHGLHSARRGDFRAIYRIDESASRVDVIAIDHRADVYRRR